MALKKTIAIVEATGQKGKEISSQFARLPYRLLLVSKNEIEVKQLARDISVKYPKSEIEPLECIKDGCWEADIILIVVSNDEQNEVAGLMKEVATQKIVVVVSDKKGISAELKTILPYSKIVTVTNTSLPKEIEISGDDNTVNEEISMIFNQAGYLSTIYLNGE